MEKTNLVDVAPKTAAANPDPEDLTPIPDTESRTEEEPDSLYQDGLNVDTEAGELFGTRGNTPGIAKP